MSEALPLEGRHYNGTEDVKKVEVANKELVRKSNATKETKEGQKAANEAEDIQKKRKARRKELKASQTR